VAGDGGVLASFSTQGVTNNVPGINYGTWDSFTGSASFSTDRLLFPTTSKATSSTVITKGKRISFTVNDINKCKSITFGLKTSVSTSGDYTSTVVCIIIGAGDSTYYYNKQPGALGNSGVVALNGDKVYMDYKSNGSVDWGYIRSGVTNIFSNSGILSDVPYYRFIDNYNTNTNQELYLPIIE